MKMAMSAGGGSGNDAIDKWKALDRQGGLLTLVVKGLGFRVQGLGSRV